MFRGGEDAGVYQVIRMKLWTRLFGGALKGELVEEGRGSVRCYCAVVVFAGGARDGGYYEVVWLRDVLYQLVLAAMTVPVNGMDSRDRRCILSTRHSSCCLS